jgi:hypothetical protein
MFIKNKKLYHNLARLKRNWCLHVFILPAVDCNVIERPVNIVAVAGATVNFSCATNEPDKVRWDFHELGPTEVKRVWNGFNSLPPYLVNKTQCETENRCNLTVKDINLKSAGSFECRHATIPGGFLGALTVLGERQSLLPA